MSRAEFDTIKADFLKEMQTSQSLVKYHAPLEARKNQTTDVGNAAVRGSSFRLIILILIPHLLGSPGTRTVLHP